MWRFLRQAPHSHPRNENSSMGDIHWNTLSSAFVLFQFNYFSRGFEGLALLWPIFSPSKNHIKEWLKRSCPFREKRVCRQLGFTLEVPQPAATDTNAAERAGGNPSPSPADKERGAGASPGSSSHSVPPGHGSIPRERRPGLRRSGKSPGEG